MDTLAGILKKAESNIVIVDDIMFYRSMRREVYVLARDHSYGHVSLFLNIPLEVALERNALRESHSRVADEVHPHTCSVGSKVFIQSLLSVYSKFEIPDTSGWESISMTVNALDIEHNMWLVTYHVYIASITFVGSAHSNLCIDAEHAVLAAIEKTNWYLRGAQEARHLLEREQEALALRGCDPRHLSALDTALRQASSSQH